MKIALIGYGKMGKELEKAALSRGHEIVCIIDVDNQEDFESEAFKSADVAIEFTNPMVAYGKYDEAMICLRKCVFFYEKSGTQNHAWPELIAEQAEIYFLLGNTEMAEQFYRRYREMTGSAGERDRNRMRDFARCLACNDKTTEGLKVLEKAFVNVLDAAGEKLDLCVWCGEKTIAGNILTSWPEKIELLGKNTGNTQEYFEDYFFHLDGMG